MMQMTAIISPTTSLAQLHADFYMKAGGNLQAVDGPIVLGLYRIHKEREHWPECAPPLISPDSKQYTGGGNAGFRQ